MTCRNRFKGGLEVCERFDIIDLRGGYERCDAAPGVTTFVVAGKKRILSRQSNWADQVFDGIGVDFDPTVGSVRNFVP